MLSKQMTNPFQMNKYISNAHIFFEAGGKIMHSSFKYCNLSLHTFDVTLTGEKKLNSH